MGMERRGEEKGERKGGNKNKREMLDARDRKAGYVPVTVQPKQIVHTQ